MFQMLRTRFGVPGVISVLALVLAMGGAAYAAKKYVITSTSQIKPSVLKSLQGKTGAAGAPGTQGSAGSKGDAGANGANGANGVSVTSAPEPKGANCTEGGSKFTATNGTTYACNGAKGNQGPVGPAGPTCDPSGACLLPSGATETGLWSASTAKGPFFLWTSISFPLRLDAAPAEHFVTFEQANEAEVPECPGSSVEPKAEPGNLCLYEAALNNLGPPAFDPSLDPLSGASLKFPLVNQEAAAQTNGSWAVTAP